MAVLKIEVPDGNTCSGCNYKTEWLGSAEEYHCSIFNTKTKTKTKECREKTEEGAASQNINRNTNKTHSHKTTAVFWEG